MYEACLTSSWQSPPSGTLKFGYKLRHDLSPHYMHFSLLSSKILPRNILPLRSQKTSPSSILCLQKTHYHDSSVSPVPPVPPGCLQHCLVQSHLQQPVLSFRGGFPCQAKAAQRGLFTDQRLLCEYNVPEWQFLSVSRWCCTFSPLCASVSAAADCHWALICFLQEANDDLDTALLDQSVDDSFKVSFSNNSPLLLTYHQITPTGWASCAPVKS